MTKRTQFLAGVKGALPLLVGVAPFGMIYGVLAVRTGLTSTAAQAMSLIVFAGSAQFIIVQLIGAGTPWLVIVVTAFVINLRHMLYSASIAPYTRFLASLWKGLLAYILVDEVYAVTITHYEQDGPPGAQRSPQPWYMLGVGFMLWTCWQLSTAAGIYLGVQIPAEWSLDFTLALTFIALVVPALKDRPLVLSAAAAGITAVAAYGLPYKFGLILAALVGIAVGLWSENKWQKSG